MTLPGHVYGEGQELIASVTLKVVHHEDYISIGVFYLNKQEEVYSHYFYMAIGETDSINWHAWQHARDY